MSDNLGPNQTRVLDSEGRSFESVVYQKRKPPLSSEVNLGGKITSDFNQNSQKFLAPSGWAYVGQILDNVTEAECQIGDVLCSSSFLSNSFKLISLDKGENTRRNRAWLNGQMVLVEGTKSGDENNIIVLDAPPASGTRIDFVFLEMWRKLITPSDVVFQEGNADSGGSPCANDLIDPAMGVETSLRIQLQYRIRVVSGIDIEAFPEGFDTPPSLVTPAKVNPQGPLSEPIDSCSNAYFSPVSGDLGLWIAGNGDPETSELDTVDGYTYAIPMFAIRRRNTLDYNPENQNNGSNYSLADYLAGIASDRPDNLYNDWIVADDILDLRHRIIVGENIGNICADAFRRLTENNLPGKMTKLIPVSDTFGIRTMQVDNITSLPIASGTTIGVPGNERRVFSNAIYKQTATIIRTVDDKTPSSPSLPGTPWVQYDEVQISFTNYPPGIDVTVIGVYNPSIGYNYGYDEYTSGTFTAGILTVIIGSGDFVSTVLDLRIECLIEYNVNGNGLSEVPLEFFEIRSKDSTNSIATFGNDIRVRNSLPVAIDGTDYYNMLSDRGGFITEYSDFGHQMIYHVPGTGISTFVVPRNLYGYDIIGIAKILVDGSLAVSPTINRDATKYDVTMLLPASTGANIEVYLYTGDKSFELNKQGRAINDCFQMIEVIPDETANGSLTIFHFDTTSKTILALGSYASSDGYGYAYVDGSHQNLLTNNNGFPLDASGTYGSITFSAPPILGAPIRIPVFVNTAIEVTEGYQFFYKALPYQGLLDSTATGSIEHVGTPLTTTAGSGAITDYTYSQGTASFAGNIVNGSGTEWLSYVKPGYLISLDSTNDSTKNYKISEVTDNTTLHLDSSEIASGFSAYTIVAKDQPFFGTPNIIDVMPTLYRENDSSGLSDDISTACTEGNPVLNTRIISPVQDISTLPPNTVVLGSNTADRGRSTVNIPSAPLGRGNLDLRFEKLDSTSYHKTFQPYVLNKDDSGRLYLMIVGSETDNTSDRCFFNSASNNDVVDIFEMPGRPLISRRLS